jgi:hypothetical protein
MANPAAKALEVPGTWVDIGAASPLFAYEPERNAAAGWSQDAKGGSSCSGTGGPYAVGLDGIYCESRESVIVSLADSIVSEVTFVWTASPEYSVSVGIDGQLQSGPASSGGVTLNAQAGPHAIRLEASSNTSSAGLVPTTQSATAFQFLGVKINTAVSPSG